MITLKTMEGVYHDDRIEPAEFSDGIGKAQIIVTFLPKIDTHQLSTCGNDEAQATDLRTRLRTFEEDWNHPGMDGYDALCTAAS